MTSLQELDAAAALVHRHVTPTPQIRWPLLCRRAGCKVWVKHENHLPTGAFKIRGGLVYLDDLRRRHPNLRGVIAATRGNHGQSIALAAQSVGWPATVVVPYGNSPEKNAAMVAYGAELIEHGRDFDQALERARRLAAERDLWMVESFHPKLVQGVASYGLELFRAVENLDAVYVPIGLGSGACGMIAARDALGLETEIVGVVAEKAAAYALSFARGEIVSTLSAATFADGMAARTPDPEALAAMLSGVARMVVVSEAEIAAAVRHYASDTHNLAEGAGAAALAALLQERNRVAGQRVAVVLSGGNLDASRFQEILAGSVPSP